jgi:hypothetical protein
MDGGFAPATPGFIAFGQTDVGAWRVVSRPVSPHSRQRSGRIPAEPYPLARAFSSIAALHFTGLRPWHAGPDHK